VEGKRNLYGVLVGKPEGRSLLRRPRLRWEDNIVMYFKVIVWEALN
jgi:hypothetical protein